METDYSPKACHLSVTFCSMLINTNPNPLVMNGATEQFTVEKRTSPVSVDQIGGWGGARRLNATWRGRIVVLNFGKQN